jgi:hypothetical protein
MLKRYLCAALGGAAVCVAIPSHAQELWKYIDKDGKVIYSDKAPKPGEKAELVKHDPKANVIEAPKRGNSDESAKRDQGKAGAVDQRIAARQKAREDALKRVEGAREALDAARNALESGREPLPEETIVVVGRTKTGATTGLNSAQRKPEYYKRIEALENAVKTAEKNLEQAETDYGKLK